MSLLRLSPFCVFRGKPTGDRSPFWGFPFETPPNHQAKCASMEAPTRGKDLLTSRQRVSQNKGPPNLVGLRLNISHFIPAILSNSGCVSHLEAKQKQVVDSSGPTRPSHSIRAILCEHVKGFLGLQWGGRHIKQPSPCSGLGKSRLPLTLRLEPPFFAYAKPCSTSLSMLTHSPGMSYSLSLRSTKKGVPQTKTHQTSARL